MSTNSTIYNKILEYAFTSDSFKEFIETYNIAISILLGVATIACIIMIVFHVTKLATSGDSASQKFSGQKGLWVSVICLVLLGGIDIIYPIIVALARGKL